LDEFATKCKKGKKGKKGRAKTEEAGDVTEPVTEPVTEGRNSQLVGVPTVR
jgi:hypothetical protein